MHVGYDGVSHPSPVCSCDPSKCTQTHPSMDASVSFLATNVATCIPRATNTIHALVKVASHTGLFDKLAQLPRKFDPMAERDVYRILAKVASKHGRSPC